MGRVIKFRCFFFDGSDYATGEMISACEALSEGYIEFEDNRLVGDGVCTIINQFTGLVDKNGKEIYEGDVLSIPYVDPVGTLHENDENYKAVVTYSNGSFVHKGYSGHREILLSNWCKTDKTEYVSNVGNLTTYLPETHLTVIGNIYENPELLS